VIAVPVGEETLGRIMNVIGEPIDEAGPISNEHMSSIVGEVPPDVAQPQVWLEDGRDRPRAEAALAALRFDRAQTGSVFCRACKEENPASFELCWHCGANL